MKLLEGEIVPDVDPEIERLQVANRQLRRDLDDARLETRRAREDADRALSALRRQLSPLYRALQMVFGELDAAGVTDTPSVAAGASAAATVNSGDPRVQAVWEKWKSHLPGYPARIIDALLIHGEMNTAQLAIAAGCKRQRISEGMVKLNKAGLINKNAGRFSLKQL